MRAWIGGASLAAALGVLVVVPSMAAVPSTQVTSVDVFTAGGRTSVDVDVRYPDAGSRKVSRRAVNRGTVQLVIRNGAGEVLARRDGSAKLPVDVPRASSVLHTYRFALPADVAGAQGLTVEVAADGQLDPDGPGPAEPANDGDTDTVDADVQDLEGAPPVYQYHVVRFRSRAGCNIYATNTCPGYFLNGADSNAPFQNNGKTGATLLLQYFSSGHAALKFVEDSTKYYISGSVVDLKHAEYSVVVMSPPWGHGPGFTGRTAGAGTPGGPLYLQLDSGPGGGEYTWSMWGYVGYS
jgi:hypothetical protein